jgi:hypothetical protein
MMGWPTGHIVSFSKLIDLIIPLAVEGILATSLSVNTSHKSSYYNDQFFECLAYLFNTIANIDEDFFDGRFLGPLAQIGQLNVDHLAKATH